MKKLFNFYLEEEYRKKLEALSKEKDCSVASLINNFIYIELWRREKAEKEKLENSEK